MSSSLAKTDKTPSTTPSLPASAKRLLADPFSLGSEIPAWQAPAVTARDAPGLRKVIAELERCAAPAPNAHIEFWINTMGRSLAIRQGSTLDAALKTAGWVISCGDLPADLWTEGCTEILKSRTFFPAPAELLALVGRKWGERKRMLERARGLLASTGAAPVSDPAKPFTPDTRKVALPSLIRSARATGRYDAAVKFETELATLQGRPLQDWATAPLQGEIVTLAVDPMRPTAPPASPEMLEMNRKAAAKFHREAGRTALAARLDGPVIDVLIVDEPLGYDHGAAA